MRFLLGSFNRGRDPSGSWGSSVNETLIKFAFIKYFGGNIFSKSEWVYFLFFDPHVREGLHLNSSGAFNLLEESSESVWVFDSHDRARIDSYFDLLIGLSLLSIIKILFVHDLDSWSHLKYLSWGVFWLWLFQFAWVHSLSKRLCTVSLRHILGWGHYRWGLRLLIRSVYQ